VGEVDEAVKSPLPHVYDSRNGLNFLIDTGSEISVLKPTASDKCNQMHDRYLSAANRSRIATYGNKAMSLKFGPNEVFKWTFIVADVAHNILGIDFIKHFGLSFDFTSNNLLNSNNNVVSKITNNLVGCLETPKSFPVTNQYLQLLTEFPALTSPRNSHQIKHNDVCHKIITTSYPCSARPRQLSTEKLACAQEEINQLIEAGIVRRSNSPYSSPLHMVPKQTETGGTFRLCGDYRQLNKITVEDKYPVPNAQTLFYRLAGANVFSKIDLVKAYHQIPMDPSSVPLTAVTTPFGLFEYLYMPFGLRNASATFQRHMDNILQGMTNALAYVDDIVVFSANEEEHRQHLLELFQRLNKNGMVINPTKSEFGLRELKFLGHLVTPEGIMPLPDRVEAIQNYPKPTTAKQLRAFLGLVNYYHRFVKNLTFHLSSLYDMLKNPRKTKRDLLTWSPENELAFDKSKKLLAEAAMLNYPFPNLPTSIMVDASDKAIGGVLQQKHDDVWKPIAFFSRKLDKTQQRYSAFDRELYAAYKAVRHFHFLIENKKFTLFTDHKPLVAAFYSRSDQVIMRRARQLSFISEFTNDVAHIKGEDNLVPDALSRIEINHISFSQTADIDYEAIARAQLEDEYILSLMSGSAKTALQLEEFPVTDSMNRILCDVSTSKPRPIVPEKFQKLIFDKFHNAAHSGVKATKNLIQQRFVWYNMNKDLKKWVQTCLSCQKGKILRHNKTPIQKFKLPSERFSHIHVDIIGPMPPSNGFRYLFTAVDRFTRWMTATPMKEITAEATAEALLNGWIQYYGSPSTISSDRGSQFTSQAWKDLLHFLGIKHITTTSYHPQSNGIVEITHRRLKDALRMQQNPSNWSGNLPLVLLHIRSTTKEELQCSPAELIYGQPLRLPQEFVTQSPGAVRQSEFVSKLKEHFKTIKPTQTRNHSEKSFVDRNLLLCKRVLIRNDHRKHPLEKRYSGPYEVLQRKEKFFNLLIDGKNKTVSVDRLKVFHEDDDCWIKTRSGRTSKPPQRFGENW